MGLVKHTAGRTFIADRSSNGNGTRTTLPLIIESFPISQRVDILFRLPQEIKGRIGRSSSQPFLLVYVGFFSQKNDDTYSTWPCNRKGPIQHKPSLLINRPGCFNRLHGDFHCSLLAL